MPRQADANWWRSESYNGQRLVDILRRRDIARVLLFLKSRGWSRAAIAAATGLTETRVRAISQGRQQVTSYDVLERLVHGLRIDRGLLGLAYSAGPSERSDLDQSGETIQSAPLVDRPFDADSPELGRDTPHAGGRSGGDDFEDPVLRYLPELRRVLDAYDFPEDGPVGSINELRAAVARVVHLRLHSGYGQLATTLPALLPELNRALQMHVGQRRAEVARLLAQAYRAADAIADKFGFFDLSARIINLMTWAASESSDEVVMATAAYVRAETFFANGDLIVGRAMLQRAADRIMPESGDAASAAYGALHMRCAVLAARAGQVTTADDHMAEAVAVAQNIPEGIYSGTVFGPSSVQIHQVTLAVDIGDPDTAVRTGRGWEPPDNLPAERRSHFYVDLARAQSQTGTPHQALESLQTARSVAPQHIRVHPDVRQLLNDLAGTSLARGHELTEFSHWLRTRASLAGVRDPEVRPTSR